MIRWLHCEVLWWWLFARLWGCWENGWPFNPRLHFFFFKVEISSCTLIPLFRSGSSHNGSASWDNSGRVFPDELCVSSFPFRFPHYSWPAALSTHSDFVGSRVYACLGITCHLHFWQNDRNLLRTISNKSQHRKLTREKKNPPAARTRNLSITSPALLSTRYPDLLVKAPDS